MSVLDQGLYLISLSPVCQLLEFCLWRWNRNREKETFLESLEIEMKKNGRSTWINSHNTRSLIRTLKVCPRHHCIQKKPLRWKSVNTHIHTKHCNGKSNRREADKKPNSASEIPVIFQNYYPLTSSNLPKSISLPIFLNCHYFNQNIFIKLTDKQRDHLLIMYANLEGGRVKPKAYK